MNKRSILKMNHRSFAVISGVRRFDCFSVEIFRCILAYFSAHEICYTFANVNSYIDAVLAEYNDYRVNFKSINLLIFEH